MTLLDEVRKGRLEGLIALRDQLAVAISASSVSESMVNPAALAALSLRLTDVLEQIDELKPPAKPKGNALDEFTRRRTEQQTAGAPVAKKRQQRGR